MTTVMEKTANVFMLFMQDLLEASVCASRGFAKHVGTSVYRDLPCSSRALLVNE